MKNAAAVLASFTGMCGRRTAQSPSKIASGNSAETT
jgi:hypothetical protein